MFHAKRGPRPVRKRLQFRLPARKFFSWPRYDYDGRNQFLPRCPHAGVSVTIGNMRKKKIKKNSNQGCNERDDGIRVVVARVNGWFVLEKKNMFLKIIKELLSFLLLRFKWFGGNQRTLIPIELFQTSETSFTFKNNKYWYKLWQNNLMSQLYEEKLIEKWTYPLNYVLNWNIVRNINRLLRDIANN